MTSLHSKLILGAGLDLHPPVAEPGPDVAARQDRVDALQADLAAMLEMSRSLSAWYREQAGGADKLQIEQFGVVLMRTWKKLRATVLSLAPAMQWGAVFPTNPAEPLGAFTDAPRYAVQEVADNLALANHPHMYIKSGAVLRLPEELVGQDGSVLPAFDYGPVPTPAKPGSRWYEQCKAAVVRALRFDEGGAVRRTFNIGGGQMVSGEPFDFDEDVHHFTCTPWLGPDGARELHVVVLFNTERSPPEETT